MQDKLREENHVEKGHSSEIKIYEMFRDQKLLMPALYYAEDKGGEGPGCILMEDLVAVSGTVGWMGSSTAGQCKNLCRPIAHFHVS